MVAAGALPGEPALLYSAGLTGPKNRAIMAPRTVAASLLILLSCLLPASAMAQSFGVGPRMSWVRGDVAADTPSTRFLGGMIRMRSSKNISLEFALDQRSETSVDGTTRLRERPFQASMLIYPARAAFSPYLLGGFGVYSQTLQHIDLSGEVSESEQSERRTGWHLGFGGELFFGRHTAFYADYRFRFVRFGGEPEEGSEPIGIPGLSRFSHRGSMWTSGVAFYF